MATYTEEGVRIDDLSPVTITQQRVPVATATSADMPEVKVMARFDWQFWAAIGAAIVGGYLLLKSMGHAGRLPTRTRVSRRMR